jgi:hypothetical protein
MSIFTNIFMARIATDKRTNTYGDNYLARVVKLIPSEVIATYLAIGNVIPALSEGHWEHSGSWINFTFFWIATPIVLFIAGKAENKRPSVTHLTMSTIAFPIWAYNVAGSVDLYGLQFRPAMAGIMLILFTFITGFIPLER